MKRLLTGLAAASLMIGVPLAAAANDRDDHRRGWERHSHHGDRGHWNKPRHVVHHYRPAPPRVVYHPVPAPRVVHRPVYVPVPAPVVAYPHAPVFDGPRVSVGFRILF
jgi:Ni/Co efflux regulator RcnB